MIDVEKLGENPRGGMRTDVEITDWDGTMSLRWLSSMVGGKRMARPGIRRKMAPEARRDLAAEIDQDVVPVRRVWALKIYFESDGAWGPEETVIVRVDGEARPDVMAWLTGAARDDDTPLEVRTDWVFLPMMPEAILIGVAERAGEPGAVAFRFNLRFPADRYRRHLEALARSGALGLTTEPLQLGSERRLALPCMFIGIQAKPLRNFLRELPGVPVV